MKDIERRAFRFELRSEGDSPRIVGHAALFNSPSETLGFFDDWREIIKPGAFAESIGRDDIRALWNHNPDYVLGRNKARTLTLREDDQGLLIENDPPDTQWARDLLVSMRRGDVTQMSFGFRVKDSHWETLDGIDLRVLTKVELFDVSPVTYPAYTQTDVSVRSLRKVYEDHLAEVGRGAASQAEPSGTPLSLRLRKLDLIEKTHNLRSL